MRNAANLDPRRWPDQMGAHADVADRELMDGTCDGCGQLQGIRPVREDPKVTNGLAGFLLLCTTCLVFDHKRRSYRWELVAVRERARFAANEQPEPVPA